MNVEFEEEKRNFSYNPTPFRTSTSKMASWVMKTGLAKNEKQATYILVALAIVCIAITVIIFFRQGVFVEPDSKFQPGAPVTR